MYKNSHLIGGGKSATANQIAAQAQNRQTELGHASQRYDSPSNRNFTTANHNAPQTLTANQNARQTSHLKAGQKAPQMSPFMANENAPQMSTFMANQNAPQASALMASQRNPQTSAFTANQNALQIYTLNDLSGEDWQNRRAGFSTTAQDTQTASEMQKRTQVVKQHVTTTTTTNQTRANTEEGGLWANQQRDGMMEPSAVGRQG
ncbi:hypothetical protein ACOMHN_013049 [Nucella lapillus]